MQQIIQISSIFNCSLCSASLEYQHVDEIEKIQFKFICSLLHFPFNTPSYVLRLETGMLSIRYMVFKSILSFIERAFKSSGERYLKWSLDRIIQLASIQKSHSCLHNWAMQVRTNFFEKIDVADI